MTDNPKLAEAEARFLRLRDHEPELSQAWESVVRARAAMVNQRTLLAIADAHFADADQAWTTIQARQFLRNDDAHAASVAWHRANTAVREAAASLELSRVAVDQAERDGKHAEAEFARVRESIPSVRRAWQELVAVQETNSFAKEQFPTPA